MKRLAIYISILIIIICLAGCQSTSLKPYAERVETLTGEQDSIIGIGIEAKF